MTRINHADQLASLMRAQIAQVRQSGLAVAPGRTSPGSVGKTRTTPKETDAAAMAASRIRAIAIDDPDREGKALRAFLECVFLCELGEDLAADPQFSRMVDHVHAQMQADPALSEAAALAAKALLAQSKAQK